MMSGMRDNQTITLADDLGPVSTSFLELRDLRVHFPTDDGLVKSVDGLSFKLERRADGPPEMSI